MAGGGSSDKSSGAAVAAASFATPVSNSKKNGSFANRLASAVSDDGIGSRKASKKNRSDAASDNPNGDKKTSATEKSDALQAAISANLEVGKYEKSGFMTNRELKRSFMTTTGDNAEDEGESTSSKRKGAAAPPITTTSTRDHRKGNYHSSNRIGREKRKLKQQRLEEEENKKRMAMNDALLERDGGKLEVGEGSKFNESTAKYRQAEILQNVDEGTKQKAISLDLPQGGYNCSYTPNGKFLLLGGKKGEAAMINTQTMELVTQIKTKESVRCVQSFHNSSFFAVSQKKCVYVYDDRGTEIHEMKEHKLVHCMDFLKHHFLLVTGAENGELKYHDTSIGKLVCAHKTRQGPIKCLQGNRWNAVVHTGHSNGCVALWTPNLKTPALKMLCHRGNVLKLATFKDYMVTSGGDGRWKIWDVRKPNDPLHTLFFQGKPVDSLDISHTGMIGVGFGCRAQVWDGKQLFNSGGLSGCSYSSDSSSSSGRPSPYMAQEFFGDEIVDLKFQPFQDILGVGTAKGLRTMIVPGAGMSMFDSYADNPFETRKQQREKEVRSLLEKLQPDMITFNPNGVSMGAGVEGAQGGMGTFKSDQAVIDETRRKRIEERKSQQKNVGNKEKYGGDDEDDNHDETVGDHDDNQDDDDDDDGGPSSEEEKANDDANDKTTNSETRRKKKKMRGRGKIANRLKQKLVSYAKEVKTSIADREEDERLGVVASKKRKRSTIAENEGYDGGNNDEGYDERDDEKGPSLVQGLDLRKDGVLARFKKKARRQGRLDG